MRPARSVIFDVNGLLLQSVMQGNLARKFIHALALVLAITGAVGWSSESFAATKYARVTGPWGTATNWSATSCAVVAATTVPTAVDDVVICNGITTTVDAAGRAASSVTVQTGATATNLTFGAGSSLAVTNNLVIEIPTGAVTKQVSVATGALTVGGNVTLTGGSAANRDALLTVSSGSIVVTGTLTIDATVATSSTVSITGAGSIAVTGAVTNRDVFSIGAGTATTGAMTTTNTTGLAATTSVTTGTLTVNGNATVNSGTNGLKAMTLTTGTITVNGALSVTAAAATSDTGDATVSVTTGKLSVTGNATVTGGSTALRDALLTVTGASAASGGLIVGGTLSIVSTIATSTTVSAGTNSRITVTGAVSNQDVFTVGAGIVSTGALTITNTTGRAATTSVTTGTLTVNGNAIVNSGTNGLKQMTLTTGTITVNGDLSVTAAAATADTGDATVSVTTGKLSVTGKATVTGGSTALRDATLTVSGVSAASGGLIIAGTLDIVSTIALSSTVSAGTNSRITVTGAVSNQDVFTVGAGIVSTGALTITNTTGFAATTSVTTGTLTVNGNAIVNSGTNGLKSMTLTTGTINITGGLTVTAAAATLDTGDATVSVTTGLLNVTGNVAVTGGSTAARDALLTITGASAAGKGINITGGLITTSAVAGSTTVSLASGSRLTAGSISNGDTLTIGAGIVVITTAGFTNSNTVTVAATTMSTGTLDMAGSFNNASGETLTCTGACIIKVAGDFTNSGTLTLATGTVTLNGTSAQTIAGIDPLTFLRLTITNTANPNITLATNVVVSTTFTGTARLSNTCPDKTFKAPGQADLHSCQAPSSLNAFDTPAGLTCPTLPVTTASGAIKTKIAGVAYSLCVVARDATSAIDTTFTADVKVDVVGNASTGVALDANGCPSTLTVLDTVSPVTLTSGRASVSFNAVANAWRDARVRVSYPAVSPTMTKCSLDNYAIRPASLSVAVTDATSDSAGTARKLDNTGSVHKAGQYFTIAATAKNGATPSAITTNYTGTPTAAITAYNAPTSCQNIGGCALNGGTFDDGTANDGIVSSSTASYAETGVFSMKLVDSSFAAVDAADSSDDELNVVSSPVPVGRFVPDHYVITTPVAAAVCTPSLPRKAFTYFGEDGFTTSFTLTAQNANNETTRNYTGAEATFAMGAPDTWEKLGFSATNLPEGSVLSKSASDPSGTWANGVVNVIAKHVVSRPTGLAVATPISLTALPVDADGVTAGTATTVGTAILLRYGRLRLSNAAGSEKLPLAMPAQLEYYDNNKWLLNEDDSCTTFAKLNVTGPVVSGITTARCGATTGSCTTTSDFVCNAATGKVINGSVNLCLTASGVEGAGDVTFAPESYLQSGSLTGRVVFGVNNPPGRSKRIVFKREIR